MILWINIRIEYSILSLLAIYLSPLAIQLKVLLLRVVIFSLMTGFYFCILSFLYLFFYLFLFLSSSYYCHIFCIFQSILHFFFSVSIFRQFLHPFLIASTLPIDAMSSIKTGIPISIVPYLHIAFSPISFPLAVDAQHKIGPFVVPCFTTSFISIFSVPPYVVFILTKAVSFSLYNIPKKFLL